MNVFARALAGVALATTVLGGSAQAATEITFYYPIAVGGPITKIIEGYTAEFEKKNPDITVKPVYTGSYQDSIVKALTAARAGNAPDGAVLLSTDMFTLIDGDFILPYDEIAKEPGDKDWLNSFYPAFMANSKADGHIWGVPFQRSTIVQYYNKEAFKAAGIDHAPKTWDELVADGKKLTKKDASGNVTQWGIEIPSSGFPYWLFQALAIQNGADLANADGTKVNFNGPKVVEAAQFFTDLSQKYEIMPNGIIELGHDAEGLLRGQDRDHVDLDRQPDQCAQERAVRVRRLAVAFQGPGRLADRRWQRLHLQDRRQGQAGSRPQVRPVPDVEGNGCGLGHGDRLHRNASRCLADAQDGGLCEGLPGCRRRPRPAQGRQGRAFNA